MTIGIGCDIGGTFTDLVMINDETGAIEVEKVLTTPADPSLGIERGLQTFNARIENRISQASLLVHGTTLVINAVLERKGAVTGPDYNAWFSGCRRDRNREALRRQRPSDSIFLNRWCRARCASKSTNACMPAELS